MKDEDVPLWWLCFIDLTAIGGPANIGTVITQAYTIEDAITGTHLLGINPGKEVVVIGPFPAGLIQPEWRDRILTKEEVQDIPPPPDDVLHLLGNLWG